MTVAQNVAYGLKFKKLTKAEIAAKVTKLLGVVRLAELKDRYSAELSGGQQQRVALARALVVEPQILLMDEPLSNLDANLREEMRFEIRRLHEEFKITTIYVTHDQAEAMATSDRIAVLNRGRLVQVGPPAEIFDRPKTRFVAEFVGKANILSGRVMDGDGRSILSDGVKIRLADGGAVSAGERSVGVLAAAQYQAGRRARRRAAAHRSRLQSLLRYHSPLDLFRRRGRLYGRACFGESFTRHRAAIPTIRARPVDLRGGPSRKLRRRA